MGFDKLRLAGDWIPGIVCALHFLRRELKEAEKTGVQIGVVYPIVCKLVDARLLFLLVSVNCMHAGGIN